MKLDSQRKLSDLKRSSKGFTLVELLVVIAILGILATVSIVGYTSYITKANDTKDSFVVDEMNEHLRAAYKVAHSGEDIAYPSQVYTALDENGYNIATIKPSQSGIYYAFDIESESFLSVESNGEFHYAGNATHDDRRDVFVFVQDEATRLAFQKLGYSAYLQESYAVADSKTLNLNAVGVDVGSKVFTTINYTNISDTGAGYTAAAQDAAVRSNSAKTSFVIDAYVDSSDKTKGDKISHYDTLGNLVVDKVAMGCYYEYGNTTYAKLVQGKIVAEEGGNIEILYGAKVGIAAVEDGGTIGQGYTTSQAIHDDNATNGGANAKDLKYVDAQGNAYTETEISSIGDVAVKEKTNVAKIDSTYYADLYSAISAGLQQTSSTIEILHDIDLNGADWIGVVVGSGKTLVINGNGYTISNFVSTKDANSGWYSGDPTSGHDASYMTGFFACNYGTLTLNNVNFSKAISDMAVSRSTSTGSSQVGVVLGVNMGTTTFNNVNVSDSHAKGYTKVGILLGHAQAGNFVANHCAISNCVVTLEADGTDSEAALSGIIIGACNANAVTNGIKLSQNENVIDSSVNWGYITMTTLSDGTIYAGSTRYYLTSPTYVKSCSTQQKSVSFVDYIDGYGYETEAQATAARAAN